MHRHSREDEFTVVVEGTVGFVLDETTRTAAAARGGAIELAVHGWDVATTCGSGHRMPVGLATDLLRAATALVDDQTRRPAFGPPVQVPAGAAPEDRLVAFLGRRPPAASW